MAPRKKKDDLPVPLPLEEPKPKRKIKIIEEPKPKRKFKIIEEPEPVNTVVEEKTPCMVESGEPIKVGIVHKVVFQKLKHASKNYYLDSERDKLYEFIAQNKHGKYIGRWDSHLEEIVTGEDSDEECV
jgi:hypothetical protein